MTKYIVLPTGDKTFDVKIGHTCTESGYTWFRVQADNAKEAKQMVKDGYGDWIDSETIDWENYEYDGVEDVEEVDL